MQRTPILLFGGSGHARAVADVLHRLGVDLAGCVDPAGESDLASLVLGSDDEGASYALDHDLRAVVAIGDNVRRLGLARSLAAAGVRLPPVVAASATVARDAVIDDGSVLMEHAHIGPRARLGLACLINTGAIVEHDCVLGDGVHCAPGSVLGGAASCGPRVLVGTGASVLPLVRVGADSRVGAGAVVLKDIPSSATIVGVPGEVRAEKPLPESE